MIDKSKLTEEISDSVYVPHNKYSVGLEIEFAIPSKRLSNEYAKEFNLNYDSWCDCNDPDISVLGYDGAGEPTKEFRSPVFISNDPEGSFNSLMEFSVEVQVYLHNEFKSKFVPYFRWRPYGIHFSVGGKYFDLEKNLIKRCKVLQPKLRSNLSSNYYKSLYSKRERVYPGKFSQYFESLDDCYDDLNALRLEEERIELRFFPSCELESLIPYLKFIIMDTSVPTNKIKFIK